MRPSSLLHRTAFFCLAFLSAPVVATLTGCGALVDTAQSAHSFDATGTLTGHIHGGNQPVTGASVKLYAAGITGYGSASTLYATTTSQTDAYGSFSFSKTGTGNATPGTNVYGCPASGDPQMYLIANGGNTQGSGNGTNSAAAFIAAIGKCSTIGAGTFVDMNEVSSIATLAALLQYFNPVTESFGYPNTPQAMTGFSNGFLTIASLANIAAGTANTSFVLSATPAGATAAVNVTVTPEASKINTLANITAACVNTASSATTVSGNCSTLFTNAFPPTAANTSQPALTFAAATDILQATYYMLANPASQSTAGTNNGTAIANLFNLSGPSAPFQPSLATAPTDWTIGISYTSASPCTYGTFLTASYQLAADASGNIWVASGGTSTTSSNLIELSANGAPATCTLGSSVALTKGLALDTVGNVWIAGNAANSPYYRYNPTTATATPFAVPAGGVPYVIAADGVGNVFYTDATNKQVNEFVAGASSATAVTSTNIATLTSSYPYFLAIDTSGEIFIPNVTTTTSISEIYPSTATGNVNGYLLAAVGSSAHVYNPYAVAAGVGGSIFFGNSASTTGTVAQTAYSLLPIVGAGTVTYSANTAQNAGGLSSTRGPNAVDGAGNIWYANAVAATGNYVTGAATSGLYMLSEFTSALVPLSPSTLSGGFQKDASVLSFAPRAVTVDPTGNVWVGSNSSTANGVFELVGAAVPVVTPISKGLAAGIAAGTRDAVVKP